MSSPSAPAVSRGEVMTTTVVVEQPNYLPWLGYFDLMRQSDVWIWYDDVQYTKRDWRNRNRIANGAEMLWLTVPVKTKGRFQQTIREVEIDDSMPWRRRHAETLRHCYASAPHAEAIVPLIARTLCGDQKNLAELCVALNESICGLLGILPRFMRSSRAGHTGADRQGRLIELCRAASGTAYLSGPAARAYIDPRRFADAGLDLRYIVYDYPPYPRGSLPFLPNLSIVDAIAWLGPAGTMAFLEAHGRTEEGP